MDPMLVTILMFLSIMILLALGTPISFALGGTGVLFIISLWGTKSLYVTASTVAAQISSVVLVAIPLFVFMGYILERTGIADDLYKMMHVWLGPINGGLAIGTVLICTIFSAMTGITGATTVTMGLIALPAMLKRGYDKTIAIGCIAAGGALGVLIPPSVLLLIYAMFAGESVGRLFVAGILPGLLLAFIFIFYIAIKGIYQPQLCPALPVSERAGWKVRLMTLQAIIWPAILIFAVLGSIFLGMATVTEAAALGAVGAIICGFIYRKFNWKVLRDACYSTLKISAMVVWIVMGATVFTSVYTALGAPELIQKTIVSLSLNKWVVLAVMQVIYFILGCLIDPIGILMITMPAFLPVVSSLGFDLVWFGVIYVVNMEMSYLTPPFGMNLFYMRGVAPKNITMFDIYRAITPFVVLQAVGLLLCITFPQIVLWLPSLMIHTK